MNAVDHRVDRGDGVRSGADDRGVIPASGEDARTTAVERPVERVDQIQLAGNGARPRSG
jgi:hypothetical protein